MEDNGVVDSRGAGGGLRECNGDFFCWLYAEGLFFVRSKP